MAKESALIRNLKNKVNKLPCTRIKKLWSSATNRDIDILIVSYGIAIFYEIKVPGEEPTSWQFNQLAWWAHSGAVTGWFDDVDACVLEVSRIYDTFDLSKNLQKAATWQLKALEKAK